MSLHAAIRPFILVRFVWYVVDRLVSVCLHLHVCIVYARVWTSVGGVLFFVFGFYSNLFENEKKK